MCTALWNQCHWPVEISEWALTDIVSVDGASLYNLVVSLNMAQNSRGRYTLLVRSI